MKSIFCFLLCVLLPIFCQGANILFFYGVSTPGDRAVAWPLVEALADKGHTVTFLAPYAPNQRVKENATITQAYIKIDTNLELDRSAIALRLEGAESKIGDDLLAKSRLMCKNYLEDEGFQNWVKMSKYDLVILGSYQNECGVAMAYAWDAKYILMNPTWSTNEFVEGLDFLQGIADKFGSLPWNSRKSETAARPASSEIEDLLRARLEIPEMPKLTDLWRDTSLVFVNKHYSFDERARNLPPMYVSTAGLHLKEDRVFAIPMDVSKFIKAGGESGFIYFNLGTLAKASDFPPELLQVFWDVFVSMPEVRFIWVYDLENPEDVPENVLTVKSTYQQTLLDHKKIKGFISAAGDISIQEAIHFVVPMILLPLSEDQDNNAATLERNGGGIKLEIRGLEKETLRKAISDILNDPGYKTRMTQLSKVFKDRPQSALELAVWWTEFVLRNEDTAFLKPISVNPIKNWYFVGTFVVAFLALVLIVKMCLCLRSSGPKKFKLP